MQKSIYPNLLNWTDVVSKNKLKKASRRVRQNAHSESDIELLLAYRDSFLPVLANCLLLTQETLESAALNFLVSGRPKRIKSIIRKISRGDVDNVSTVADLAGIRVVVKGLSDQAATISEITRHFKIVAVKDYLLEPIDGYRAFHLYVLIDGRKVEIQVRTIPQQLWANESESLGEHVKHGGGTDIQRCYLDQLSEACHRIDDGAAAYELQEIEGLGGKRGPLHGRLPVISRHFEGATRQTMRQRSFILVYDGMTNELLSIQPYNLDSIDGAIDDFNYKSQFLDEERFDVLMLNAQSERALKVTHPRYFPSI